MTRSACFRTGPWWGSEPGDYVFQAIDAGAFDAGLIEQVRAIGQPLRELPADQVRRRVSYWAGIRLDRETGALSGAVSPDFNGLVESGKP